MQSTKSSQTDLRMPKQSMNDSLGALRIPARPPKSSLAEYIPDTIGILSTLSSEVKMILTRLLALTTDCSEKVPNA